VIEACFEEQRTGRLEGHKMLLHANELAVPAAGPTEATCYHLPLALNGGGAACDTAEVPDALCSACQLLLHPRAWRHFEAMDSVHAQAARRG